MAFYPLNLFIVGLAALPNLLFIAFPPNGVPEPGPLPPLWNAVIVLEWVGRIGALALPVFWELSLKGRAKGIVLACMAVCVVIYYAGWLRYLFGGREFRLLFEPLLFIPVPMAVVPCVYLILTGVLLSSWPVIIAALVFAAGHIPESLRLSAQ